MCGADEFMSEFVMLSRYLEITLNDGTYSANIFRRHNTAYN